ncbi:Maf family nucleotide pyrophosphatase [Pseudozobellia thermophila]|uniref:dTTP/UTP pyrophosphatase n=1 Tax=Pseudozobellia thermophila TaxID=192903 RepID=A0A1M6LGD9_9FLAO|nr:Maf family nucleotide pyrophosphatase [Pseudozobellia thermophila]SHJ70155.1 septum formation protein [Pseudozobellia thermophila]
MLQDKLRPYTLILGSGSPRRQQFLKEMGLDFEIRVKSVEETYPEHLQGGAISDYLAVLKASAHKNTLAENEILITSDTVVWHKGKSLAKAAEASEARSMLMTLSNDWHEVITSVCFTTLQVQNTVRQTTQVKFKALSEAEIDYYIENFRPFDKAGAYGIQEWIGLIGIEEIRGSYTNVVGLPTQLVYSTLANMVK